MQKLTWSETEVAGGKRVDTLLLRPATELGYYRDIAVLAFPSFKNGKPVGFSDWQLLNNSVFNHRGKIGIQTYDKEQVIRLEDIIDLTNQVDSLGRLNWEAPLGNWTVIRLGHTSTGRKKLCSSGYRRGA